MTQSEPLTPETAELRREYWQRALRLQDWQVQIQIGRLHELGEGTLGDCRAHSTKRQAQIRLLDPRDLGGQGWWFDGEAWDWEITLVHELLHLHFHDVFGQRWPGEDKAEGVAAERAIDAMAKALVHEHRS